MKRESLVIHYLWALYLVFVFHHIVQKAKHFAQYLNFSNYTLFKVFKYFNSLNKAAVLECKISD